MSEARVEDVDSALKRAGDMGRFQCLLMALFSFVNVISAFHYFGQIFISVVPEHWCKGTEGAVNVSECTVGTLREGVLVEEACEGGWDYRPDYGYISIVQEYDWVCRDGWIPVMGQSIFFTGSVVGTLVFGVLSDRFGRLHVLVLANMCALFGNLSTVFCIGATTFILSRFVAGLATDSNFVMMYIIVLEYIRPSTRTFGLNICIGVFYCLACVSVPWVAVKLQTWNHFLLVVSIPHACVLLFYLLVPESAQWLISKGRTEEAVQCLKSIAKINRRNVDEAVFDDLRRYAQNHVVLTVGKNDNILGLLKTPKLRRKTILLAFKSMVMTLCYDAISRNVQHLDYSPFIVFSITSTTIFPACAFILATQDRVGRKALASVSLFISGIFTSFAGILLATMLKPNPAIVVSLALVARLAINVAYNSGAQYAVELIPTVVRGQGVSVIHVTGYVASFFSPQILYLSTVWKPAPEVVLGFLLVGGALACLFLPETLHRTLPVTLEEGEAFGEGERIFEFACCSRITDSTAQLAVEDNKIK